MKTKQEYEKAITSQSADGSAIKVLAKAVLILSADNIAKPLNMSAIAPKKVPKNFISEDQIDENHHNHHKKCVGKMKCFFFLYQQ